MGDDTQRDRRVAWLLVALWAALYAMRLLGPVDLVTRSQGLSLAYITDILANHHWIAAFDNLGDPASKPPLHSWLAAVSVAIFGRSWFAASLPSALATLATILWILRWGGRRLGFRAGSLAALAYATCLITVSLLPVVRPDALFTLCIAVAGGAAFDAWRGRASWWPFWIWVTLAGLAKGPHGLPLAAAGLGAALWERPGSREGPSTAGRWSGLAVFLGVNLGWFALGWWQVGRPFVDELIGDELVGHALHNDRGRSLLTNFWQPTAYLLGRFLPWSLALFAAVPRVVRRPDPDPDRRALERFLVSWLGFGLLLLSVVGHKRADLVAPLVPAAALLVGRELAVWTGAWSTRRRAASMLVATAVLLAGLTWYHHDVRARNRLVRLSVAEHRFADRLVERVPDGAGLVYATGRLHPQFYYIPQFMYGTLSRPVSPERAVELLAGGRPVRVVTPDVDGLRRIAHERGVRVGVELAGDDGYALVSNRPAGP